MKPYNYQRSTTSYRARARACANHVALDIHPVNNLRAARYLKKSHIASADQVKPWTQHWTAEGFAAAKVPASQDSTFAFGDQPGPADLCIVAQAHNARRWNVDMAPYRKRTRIEAACLSQPAIDAARPENQPDAPQL